MKQREEKKSPPGLKKPWDWSSIIFISLLILFTAAGTVFLALRPDETAQAWVVQSDLPAYHLLTVSDAALEAVAGEELPAAALAEDISPVGAYTTTALTEGAVLGEEDVVLLEDPAKFAGTTVAAVTVGSASALGGDLAPGTTVSIWGKPAGERTRIEMLGRGVVIHVADIKLEDGAYVTERTYLAVLAVPTRALERIVQAQMVGEVTLVLAPARKP